MGIKTIWQDLRSPVGKVERDWLRRPTVVIILVILVPVAVVWVLLAGVGAAALRMLDEAERATIDVLEIATLW